MVLIFQKHLGALLREQSKGVKDTNREKARSNKTTTFSKNINMKVKKLKETLIK